MKVQSDNEVKFEGFETAYGLVTLPDTSVSFMVSFFFFLMTRPPPRSTQPTTLFPYTTLFRSVLHYPGTCLFEGTNLSVGRGTAFAFQVIGAPWLDTAAVLSRLRVWGPWAQGALTGVEVSGVVFTPRGPTDDKYDDVEVR